MSRPKDIERMRSEIKTLEQFKSIGVAGRVAIRYGVDHADAVKFYKELEAIAKEEEELSKNKEAEKRVKQMQVEITTVEQFRAIGNTDRVVKKYGISKSSAANHLTRLMKEKGQQKPQEIPTPTPSNLAPSEPEGVPESDCTSQVVSVACTPNLNEVEKFFEEPQPNLSEVTKPKFLKFESEKELALELVATVTAKVTLQIKAELRQKITDYFQDAWQVLNEADTGRKVDELYIAIQRELLTDVKNGVFERLGEGVA